MFLFLSLRIPDREVAILVALIVPDADRLPLRNS